MKHKLKFIFYGFSSLALVAFILYYTLPQSKSVDISSLKATPTASPTPTPTLQKIKLLTSIRPDGSKLEVARFPSGRVTDIVRWNDLLFFGSSEGKIKSHSVTTGETSTVFDFGHPLGDFYITLAGSNLFFTSTIGYEPVDMYWTMLPLTTKPQKIFTGMNPELMHHAERYWIAEGIGDSCVESHVISTFDISTKKTQKVFSGSHGCSDGDGFIDIDNSGNLIANTHIAVDDGSPAFERTVSVSLINVDNPSQRSELISTKSMPPNIFKVAYSRETNKLVLLGESLYTFDMVTNQLVLVGKMGTTEDSFHFKSIKDGIACIENYADNTTTLWKANLSQAKVSVDDGYCASQPYSNQDPRFKNYQSEEDTIRNLVLPYMYSIEEREE